MNLVLHKLHRGERKMVGKIFAANGRRILLHEESGTQHFHKNDSPGGVEYLAVWFAQEAGVQEVHHHRRGARDVLVVTPERLLTLGVRETHDGRDRIFLAESEWESRGFEYEVPWIRAVKLLDDLAAPRWEPIRSREPEPAGPPRLPGFEE